MPTVTASEFLPALERLLGKVAVPISLSTAEWGEVALALRERAFFSAKVAQLDILNAMQDKLVEAQSAPVAGRATMDKSKFVAEMRSMLGAPQGDSNKLTDLGSQRRLELIYRHNLEDAAEFGRWKVGQDEAVLDQFPAQELVRIESRRVPRDWRERWQAAGGKLFGGRMVAAKDAPVWYGISRFGKPWPPFDFNSGMGVRDIERDEAEALGVIAKGARPRALKADFNAAIAQSLARMPEAEQQAVRAALEKARRA